MSYNYWVEMALCGEGVVIDSWVYFGRQNKMPIRVFLYMTNWYSTGDKEEEYLAGISEEVPWIGY